MNKQDMAALSGERDLRKVALPVYDEIALNGNDGIFYRKFKTKPKVKNGDNEEFEKAPIGNRIEYVWLKLRRQMVERNGEGTVRQTSEHNTKKDNVTIYHYNGQATEDNVPAESLNGETGKYPKMKVWQWIYAYDIDNNRIVKIKVKGGSLRMQEKLEGATLYYDYIQNMEKDEHFYTQTNVMLGTKYKTKLGDKFYSDFSKGRELTDEEVSKVASAMKLVVDQLREYDESKKVAETLDAAVEDLPSIDYGDAGVNVDDIPF